MGSFIAAIIAAILSLVFTVWLLFFTDATLLQVSLIGAIFVADFIGDRLK